MAEAIARNPHRGPLSCTILDVVLSRNECMFDHITWHSLRNSLGVTGRREHYITLGRYVDDMFAATWWFCPECTKWLVDRVHCKTITFAPACDAQTTVREFSCLKLLGLWYMPERTKLLCT